MLRRVRYIQLQEEYIKDEQRFAWLEQTLRLSETNPLQESKKRISTSTRRDQTYPKCTAGHWSIHGSHRSEVSLPKGPFKTSTNIIPSVLVSCNHPQVPTMSFGYSQHSIARSLSHPPPSPSIATPTPSLISSPPRPTPPLPCLVRMRSQM